MKNFNKTIRDTYKNTSINIQQKALVVVHIVIVVSILILLLITRNFFRNYTSFTAMLLFTIYALFLFLFLTTILLVYKGKYKVSASIISVVVPLLGVLALFARIENKTEFAAFTNIVPYFFLIILSIALIAEKKHLILSSVILLSGFIAYFLIGSTPPNRFKPEDTAVLFYDLLFAFIIIVILAFLLMKQSDKALEIAEDEAQKSKERYDINQQLRELKLMAEMQNEAKSEFLANMNHELRTPLNNVHGYLELLKKTGLDQQQGKYVNIIMNNAKNLLGIINDVLDFSKIESGKMELDTIPFKPEKEFQSVIELFFLKALSKNITLLSFIDPLLPDTLIGDPLRIKQVLTNLLDNAIKFTEENGIVRISIEQIKQTKTLVSIQFTVEDSGIGIPGYLQKKIFESFTQEHPSITGHYGGTGLGLTICSLLVSIMGSKLELSSQQGAGSTFYFTIKLPVEKDHITKKPLLPVINTAIYSDDYRNNLQKYLLIDYLKQYQMRITEINSLDDLPEESDVLFYYVSRTNPQIDHTEQISQISGNVIFIMNDITYKKEQLSNHFRGNVLTEPITGSKILECLEHLQETGPESLRPKQEIAQNIRVKYSARALVAEDNPESQMLVKIILEEQAIAVDTANNGDEAINKIKSNVYEIIFLDINMPVYDGVEVAEITREYEHETNRSHTPLIALTAMAIKGKKDEYLSSGFDDFLPKPVEISDINAILNKYLGHLKQLPAPQSAPGKKNTRSGITSYDIQKVSDELNIPIPLYKSLLTKALASYNAELPRLKKAINSHNMDEIYTVAHKLKGSFANFRFEELMTLTLEIENNAKDKKACDYLDLYNTLFTRFQSVELELQKNLDDGEITTEV